MTLGVCKRTRMMRRADRWWASAYHRQLIFGADPKTIDNQKWMCSDDGGSDELNVMSDGPTITKHDGD